MHLDGCIRCRTNRLTFGELLLFYYYRDVVYMNEKNPAVLVYWPIRCLYSSKSVEQLLLIGDEHNQFRANIPVHYRYYLTFSRFQLQ